jgi:hypothetical protein
MSTRKITRKKPSTLTKSGPAPGFTRIKRSGKAVVSPNGGASVVLKQDKPPIIKGSEQ